MSDIIEQVAEALYLCDRGKDYSQLPESSDPIDVGKDVFRKCARAAIEVMREPSPEMLEAFNEWALCAGDIDRGYQAMIDAALGYGKKDTPKQPT